jgi:uncharacterized membrane protein
MKVRFLSLLTCLVIVLSVLCLPVVSLAQDGATDNVTENVTLPGEVTPVAEPEPVPADSVTLTTEFPELEAIATGSYQFSITMNYKGQADRVFDLKTSAPSGWDVYIQPQYEAGKRISSIAIDSSYSGMSKSITAVISTPTYPPPDPGEYKILVEATSGNVSGSIELTAKITAQYKLSAAPTNQLYNTSALSGKDNIFSIQITNLGSAPIDNITFDSTHPDGWEIKYTPDKLDSIKTSDPQSVDVNIKPPPKTVAGFYKITLNVSGKQASADKMDIMVEVKTPTIWGWVAVIIIVIVIAGLFVIFMRFGRR